MKIFWLLIFAVTCAAPAASAQMGGEEPVCMVPTAIRSDFLRQHPEAEEIFWELWERGYKASFYEKGLSKEQFFSASGQEIYGCTYLDASELPQAVRQFLSIRYPGRATPSVALRMERPNHTILYRVHMDVPEGLLELVFDEGGRLRGENLEAYGKE